mgnify:CR=1 FL=1
MLDEGDAGIWSVRTRGLTDLGHAVTTSDRGMRGLESAVDNPPDVVAANERLLKGLGLFPRDASLADLYVELLGSQVAGFYSPDDKQLYVLSKTGALGPGERVTVAH